MAVGLAMAQQMMNQAGGILGQTTPVAGAAVQAAPAPAATGGVPETLGLADAAKLLGVSEADVTASLEAGDLKGRKIGSQWRITRAALAAFLQ
jgi:excisionase family DNA binding protein